MGATFQEIARLLTRIDDDRLMHEFLTELLTPTEVGRVEQRWELVKLLDQGVSQREVARRLGLSLCNITRGSKQLKKPGSAFRLILEQKERKEDGNDEDRT